MTGSPSGRALVAADEHAPRGREQQLARAAVVALVTARAARGLDEDMPPLVAAFAAQGASAEIVDWDDAAVDWARFDLVLLRSAWDYAERLPEFLAWVERTAAMTLLLNPPPVVHWNSDKHYLRELRSAGVPIVPTTYVEAGAAPGPLLADFLRREPCAELVAKPAVGAGSRDARRHARTATGEILAHLEPLLAAGRAMMLQPYLESVDRDGETAVIFIEGRFSHAIRKGPLLPAAGAPSTPGLFAPEEITARVPGADELRVAEQAIAVVPHDEELLYARVDLIRDAQGHPCVLELEITEPSLFFAYVPAAPRFVSAALRRLMSHRTRHM